MDPTTSPDILEPILVGGGVVVTAVLGYLVARRARKKRLEQIEAAEPARPLPAPEEAAPRARTPEPEVPREDEAPRREVTREVDVGDRAPSPEPAAPEAPEPERPPAQVLPFPVAKPSPTAVPVEKPRAVPEAVPVKARKADTALVAGLAKTRGGWVARLGQIFSGKREIDPSLVEEIEKVLLTADIGVRTSTKLLDEIRQTLSKKEIANPDAVWDFLRRRSAEILGVEGKPVDFSAAKPFVLLVIGVNGTGKTTTIGKLAAKLKAEGKSVILAAGDTFRAAASEQLEVWGSRTGCPVVRSQKEGADPSSVIFDAIKRAKAENVDVVIADTAGRLHTKNELMDELGKVRRVIGKAQEGAPHETWLVLDSTSGQNAIAQAQVFTQAMQVSGIVLTKLDGTAKGGVILGICDQLNIPVRFIGVGERVEDLQPFDPEAFVDALFERSDAAAE